MTGAAVRDDGAASEGGDAACWAHAVCADCGAPAPDHHWNCSATLVSEIVADNDAPS